MPTKTHAVPPTTTTFLYDNTWDGVGGDAVGMPPPTVPPADTLVVPVVPAPPAKLSVTPR